VWEVSGKLPADKLLTRDQLDTISMHLLVALTKVCPELGGLDFEPAFEHVFGEGFGKDAVTHSIDLEQ
jgi:hypothetical protein